MDEFISYLVFLISNLIWLVPLHKHYVLLITVDIMRGPQKYQLHVFCQSWIWLFVYMRSMCTYIYVLSWKHIFVMCSSMFMIQECYSEEYKDKCPHLDNYYHAIIFPFKEYPVPFNWIWSHSSMWAKFYPRTLFSMCQRVLYAFLKFRSLVYLFTRDEVELKNLNVPHWCEKCRPLQD